MSGFSFSSAMHRAGRIAFAAAIVLSPAGPIIVPSALGGTGSETTLSDAVAGELIDPATDPVLLEAGRRGALITALEKGALPYARSLPTFAGVWMDEATGEISIAFTDRDDLVQQTIEELAGDSSRHVTVVGATVPYRSLSDAFDNALDLWAKAGSDVKALGFGIDERANSLVVRVESADLDAARAQADQFAALVSVPVVVVASQQGRDLTCTSRENCYSPLRAGDFIRKGSPSGTHCTMGDDYSTQASDQIYGWVNYPMYNAAAPIQGETLYVSVPVENTTWTGTVAQVSTSWLSETANVMVNGSSMDVSGDHSPLGGDSGSPIFRIVHDNGGTQYTPIGVVDHERYADGSYGNHDIYFAKVLYALQTWGASIYGHI